MAEVHVTARIERPIDEVFAYLADFSNTAEWDPGIAAAERLDAGPVGAGSRFRVVLALGPARIPVVYEIVEHSPHRRVVLDTRGPLHTGRDDITLVAEGTDVTRLEWRARFGLRGPGRLLDPALEVGFRRAAREAIDGLVGVLGGAVQRV